MEMRAVMNGWTQEGMNGVQEAVDSGWRKQHLAFGACCSVPCGDKSLFQNENDFNNSTCISIITECQRCYV